MEPDSFHWWHSERSSNPAIAQWVGGRWFCINESGAVAEAELHRRGWEYLGPVTHRPHSDYLDR